MVCVGVHLCVLCSSLILPICVLPVGYFHWLYVLSIQFSSFPGFLTRKAGKIYYHKVSSYMFISKTIASICNPLFLLLWETNGGAEAEVIEIVCLRQAISGRPGNAGEKYFVNAKTQIHLSTS